ncbi:hypothetical protein L226DRAFT_226732 [Lentinus tigrinus ALCF2SS1-7]|uniref:uncharacterized protein n=1 Tax=Lentinus tigrinus ALCF2SS1-7 TaxID=1328758 RepID=UPI00116625D8|nr:hypothetical protein L226DRAFT_226732 [Lentinus tigrinus ALCF2SS1-7]
MTMLSLLYTYPSAKTTRQLKFAIYATDRSTLLLVAVTSGPVSGLQTFAMCLPVISQVVNYRYPTLRPPNKGCSVIPPPSIYTERRKADRKQRAGQVMVVLGYSCSSVPALIRQRS